MSTKLRHTLTALSGEDVTRIGCEGRHCKPVTDALWAARISLRNFRFSRSHNAMWPAGLPVHTIGLPSTHQRIISDVGTRNSTCQIFHKAMYWGVKRSLMRQDHRYKSLAPCHDDNDEKDDDRDNDVIWPVRKLMAVTGPQSCLNVIRVSSNSMLWITVRPSDKPTAITFSSGDFNTHIMLHVTEWNAKNSLSSLKTHTHTHTDRQTHTQTHRQTCYHNASHQLPWQPTSHSHNSRL